MSDSIYSTRRARRLLSAEQKYEIWLKILTGEVTTNEAAAQAGVDRSTVLKLRKVAKDGAISALQASRPGRRNSATDSELAQREPTTPGCRPRSSSRRSIWPRCGEKRPGAERPDPPAGPRRREGKAADHHF